MLKLFDVFTHTSFFIIRANKCLSRHSVELFKFGAATYRWTHIAVDFVYGKMDLYEVVFLATADGKIRKMFKVPRSNKTCLIEEIKIVPNGEPKPVKAMKISPESVKYILKNPSFRIH